MRWSCLFKQILAGVMAATLCAAAEPKPQNESNDAKAAFSDAGKFAMDAGGAGAGAGGGSSSSTSAPAGSAHHGMSKKWVIAIVVVAAAGAAGGAIWATRGGSSPAPGLSIAPGQPIAIAPH
jgi:hypothetical protein